MWPVSDDDSSPELVQQAEWQTRSPLLGFSYHTHLLNLQKFRSIFELFYQENAALSNLALGWMQEHNQEHVKCIPQNQEFKHLHTEGPTNIWAAAGP